MKPEGSKVNYQELAERFYTLDTEVYEASGSELGKVFPGPKHISVKQILKDFEREDTEKLKDELILIGNMIKIIEENGGRYEELFIRYEHLCNDMMAVMEDDGFRDQISKDFTKDRHGLMYKTEKDHVVICIARETGAGGHEIGSRLAGRLGFSFYDDSVLDLMIDELDEKMPGIGGKDLHFIKQSHVIKEIAKAGDSVIVGRSCGHVLMTGGIPRLSVFIGAPYENRVRRKMLLNNQDRREAEEFIRKTDKRRKTSYDYYTGKKWGNPADFDICINSACYGINGTVDLLERLVQYSLDKK